MRFGIVGTNFISDEFMKGVKSLGNKINVTSVCSKEYENAVKFADKYKIKNFYKNHTDMLNSGEIDAIYIAVPNKFHYQMALDSVSRKIPCFCEKPLAINLKQAQEMVELAIKNKTYLHNGIVPLYQTNLKKLKNSLEKIGPIRRAVLAMNQYSSRYDSYLNGNKPSTFIKSLGNGSLMDLGIYLISLAVSLFGKPRSIQGSSVFLASDVDGASSLILTYEGFDVIILCSKISDSNIRSEISGEAGSVIIDSPSLLKNISLINRKSGEIIPIASESNHHFKAELKEFLTVIEKKSFESKMVPYQLSLDIMEVMDKARLNCNIKYDED